MSLAGFQQALCALIASPALCRAVRHDPGRLSAAWELSGRERMRLVAMARHRGMATNCSLYRANRLTPVWTLLPRCCFLLGPALPPELDLYWEAERGADAQFGSEVNAFAAYLRARLASGQLAVAYLRETLDFEVTSYELPRLADGRRAPGGAQPEALLRALRFSHEPATLLGRLSDRLPPPYPDLPAGEFWLLLDARSGELRTSPVAPEVGRDLAAQTAPAFGA